MSGIGPMELFVALPLFLLTFVLPIVVVVWVIRQLMKISRKLDEVLSRLTALEEGLARR